MQELDVKSHVNDSLRMALQREFVERCRKNSAYSLRAFARSLGIEASPLSGILRGKRTIGPKLRKQLGLALGLSSEELDGLRDKKNLRLKEFQQITLDNYALISDWYHYAILELIRIKSFKPSLSFVAQTLDITNTEAHIAVERLKRLGLLEVNDHGEWIDTSKDGFATNINDSITSAASKKLQRQILELSLKALDTVPIEKRDHTSMTMAVNPKDLPEARARIKKFRRELCAYLERNEKPTEIYQLGIGLFPVTKNED